MLRGCIPVFPTPLVQDLSIDGVSVNKIISWFEANDTAGYWVLGTGGEDMHLTQSQRKNLIDILLQQDEYVRKKLLVGCSFMSVTESLDMVKWLNDKDIGAIHYMPYHQLKSESLIIEDYKRIAALSDHPVYAYTSANWCKKITFNGIKAISQIDNIIGIKYSTSNIVDTINVLGLQSDSFQVIPAVVKQLLPSLCCGAHAFTTIEAAVFLPLIKQIYHHYVSDDINAALAVQQKLNSLIECTSTSAATDNFLRISEIKYILSAKGMCQPYVTNGYRPLNDDEKVLLNDTLSKIEVYQ